MDKQKQDGKRRKKNTTEKSEIQSEVAKYKCEIIDISDINM